MITYFAKYKVGFREIAIGSKVINESMSIVKHTRLRWAYDYEY